MNKTNLITNSLITLGLEESEGKGKGRYFQSKFIEAGIAHYDELGDILITKETLDKFIHTMVGCPVIINHKDVTDKNVDKLRVGVISKVWFNEADGWYYCEGILTDQQAIDLIKNKDWNVSCSYNFVSDNQKKTYHGKEIDMEFIDGEFLHLAIVENPRYEGANIVVNSKGEVNNGGKGSGNFEHDGRPGKIGGSSSGYSFLSDIKNNEIKTAFENSLNKIKELFNYDVEFTVKEGVTSQASFQVDEGTTTITLKENMSDEDIELIKKERSTYTHFYNNKNIDVLELVATHEIGHIFDNKFSLRKEFIDRCNKEYSTNNFRDYADEVSDYSLSFGDGHEFIAEAFTRYIYEKENAPKPSLILAKIIKEKINKVNNNTEEKENIPMAVLDELKSFILSVVNNEEDKKEEKETVETEKEVENEDEEKEENKCKNEAEDKKEDEAENEDDEELEEKEEVIKNEDDEDDEKAENEDDEKEKEVENKKVKNSISDMKRIVSGEGTKIQKESLYTSQAERLELGNEY